MSTLTEQTMLWAKSNFIRINKSLDLSHEERNCLSLNIYWEARNQDTPGQVAVAFVTINRKLNKYFKNSLGHYKIPLKYIKKNILDHHLKNNIVELYLNEISFMRF